MASVELTPTQADALRRAAQASIEETEEQFRSGDWEQWDYDEARLNFSDMALLLECMDLLLLACPPRSLFQEIADMAPPKEEVEREKETQKEHA